MHRRRKRGGKEEGERAGLGNRFYSISRHDAARLAGYVCIEPSDAFEQQTTHKRRGKKTTDGSGAVHVDGGKKGYVVESGVVRRA